MNALTQYPGPHLHVEARIVEMPPSLAAQLPVPGRVYLHKAVVVGPVPIVVDRRGIEITFGFCDGPKKLRRHPVSFAGLLEAESPHMLGGEDYENDREETPPGGTDIANLVFQPFHDQGYYFGWWTVP